MTTAGANRSRVPPLPVLKPMDDPKINAAIRHKMADERMVRIEQLPPSIRAKITYIAVFLAEMVWSLSDSLCDTMASAKLSRYKPVTRRLRELRREYDALLRRDLSEEDVTQLRRLVVDYEATYATLLKQLRFALRSHFRDIHGSNAYWIASAAEELLIVHEAVAKYLQTATTEVSGICRFDISRVLHEPYYNIGTTLRRLGFERLPQAGQYVAQFVATFNALRPCVVD